MKSINLWGKGKFKFWNLMVAKVLVIGGLEETLAWRRDAKGEEA